MIERKQYYKYFQSATRVNGDEFFKLSDDAPQDLQDLVQSIHFGALPNDWVYQVIMEAFEELSDNDLDDINMESDPYYHDLYKWFGQPFAHALCNEVMIVGFKNIYEIIGFAQQQAKQRIYEAVNEYIQA